MDTSEIKSILAGMKALEFGGRDYLSNLKLDFDHGKPKKDVVAGTLELAAATGLDRRLPTDFGSVFAALIAYRNSMFHNGMEWPAEERDKFQKRISKKKWRSDWFDLATGGGDPWVFYMSETFVQRCLTAADELLDAFASLVQELIEQRPQTSGGGR